MLNLSVEKASQLLPQGGILAYPTEAVYGLGCDPFNQASVERLLTLKGRGAEKGFILLIADWSQLFPLIRPVTEEQLTRVRATWPGFVTWVFPKAPSLPEWLTGTHDSVAIRMSAHPIARVLSAKQPIISTSANPSGQPPAKNEAELRQQLPTGIDAVVQGKLGECMQPSAIYDVLNNLKLR